MTIVRQILQQKGTDVWSVKCDSTLQDVLRVMRERRIGAVPVIENGKIEGIFSERDFAKLVADSGEFSLGTPICKLMTKLVFYIPPDLSVEECMALMTEKRIRHLPVVTNGNVEGIISIGDVVKALITQKDVTIRSLENYIMGRDYNR